MNPGRPVYLAGAIDAADDPKTWREGVKDALHDDIEVIDPLVQNPEWPDDGYDLIEWDLRQAARCDLIVGNMGLAHTVGTHYEIERALMNGNYVVAHVADESNVHRFVLDRPGITKVDTLEEAIDWLHAYKLDPQKRRE